jgi:hypothetical protein
MTRLIQQHVNQQVLETKKPLEYQLDKPEMIKILNRRRHPRNSRRRMRFGKNG